MTMLRYHKPSFYKNFDHQDFKKSFVKHQVNFKKPLVNIEESNHAYTINFAVPGLQKSDFNIKIDKQILIVSAHKEVNQESDYKLREFFFGEFERKFELPNTADTNNIEATYIDGILAIKIAKKPEAKPKTISID